MFRALEAPANSWLSRLQSTAQGFLHAVCKEPPAVFWSLSNQLIAGALKALGLQKYCMKGSWSTDDQLIGGIAEAPFGSSQSWCHVWCQVIGRWAQTNGESAAGQRFSTLFCRLVDCPGVSGFLTWNTSLWHLNRRRASWLLTHSMLMAHSTPTNIQSEEIGGEIIFPLSSLALLEIHWRNVSQRAYKPMNKRCKGVQWPVSIEAVNLPRDHIPIFTHRQ